MLCTMAVIAAYAAVSLPCVAGFVTLSAPPATAAVADGSRRHIVGQGFDVLRGQEGRGSRRAATRRTRRRTPVDSLHMVRIVELVGNVYQ